LLITKKKKRRKKVEKTINWTAGSGQKIEVSVKAVYETNLQGVRKTSGRMTYATTGTIDGAAINALGVDEIRHPIAVAKFGPVAMTRENYDRYLSAVAEVYEEIKAHNAKFDRREDERDQVAASSEALRVAMAYGEGC
jgi:hypothetical protein